MWYYKYQVIPHQNLLSELMQTPLPSIAAQKERCYVPMNKDIIDTYQLLNSHIFGEKLKRPRIILTPLIRASSRRSSLSGEWGIYFGNPKPQFCKIKLNHQFFCIQWMIMVLAHEMCHQVQWDIQGPVRMANNLPQLLSHGKTFFEYRDQLAEYGIPLKAFYSTEKWFKKQNLMRI